MLPFMPIMNMAVRVVTSNDSSAGTDNDVYFDIGPLGWELLKSGSQFEAGSDEKYPLVVDPFLGLTTDDIVWARLQKKGLFGYHGTPDGSGGGWKPKFIDLIVNNLTIKRFQIDRWLDRFNPVWQQEVRPTWSEERKFARTTRLRPNSKLGWLSESVASLTTQVKVQGVSGWLDRDFDNVCAIGTVVRPPGVSTDGLATIDLKLALLNIGGRRYRFDSGHGITGPRYIRVEYFFLHEFMKESPTFITNGHCLSVCGKLKWDTDNEGWYEIHPRGPDDVKVLGNGECSLTSLPGHSTLSLKAAIATDFQKADLSRGLKALDPALGVANFSLRTLIKSSAF